MQLSRWNIAVDLTERSDGAVRFALALRGASLSDPFTFDAAYVITNKHGPADQATDTPTTHAEPEDFVRAHLGSIGASQLAERVIIGSHDSPAEWLHKHASTPAVDGLIMGRAAQAEGWSLLALGRVARRLIRELPAPTFIVPPDYEGELRPGPIVAAVAEDDLQPGIIKAADQLADRLNRGRVAVRAVPPPPVPPAGGVALTPTHLAPGNYEELKRAAEARVRSALGSRVSKFDVVSGVGSPTGVVLEVAQEMDAAFIVCGSADRGFLSSLFNPDVGKSVAKNASRPVLLIPPG